MKKTAGNASEAGNQLVRNIHRNLQIEPEWCIWDDQGFTWWGKDLAQRVWADPPQKDALGETFQRVHAETDVFDGFDDSEKHIALLNALNINATMSALVIAEDVPGRVRLCSSMLLYLDNATYVAHVFSTAVALQAAEAFVTASWFPGEINAGLVPAESAHPQSGPRLLGDEMLELIETGIKPVGEGTSRYEGAALEKLGKDLLRPPCLFATASPDGITAEFPHCNHSYMLRLQTAERHPRLGSGLLATLNLPEGTDDIQTAREALALNSAEAISGTHFLGSWCATASGLAFSAFFPNTIANDGIPVSVAFNMVHRAKWHSETFHKYDWAQNFQSCMERYMQRLTRVGLGTP